MTCVIGHRSGWMAADRMCLWGGTIQRPVDKITRTPGMLFATVGDAGSVDAWLRDERWGRRRDGGLKALADVVRGAPGDNCAALALNRDGLWAICGNGSIEPAGEFWSLGSGSDFAMGYLEHARSSGRRVTRTLAVQAIQAASQRIVGVSFETQVERL